jgi:predicted dienelactone hydrolase
MTHKAWPIALLALSSGSAAANPIDQIRPDAPALAPFGEYAIGVQTIDLVDPGRPDILRVTEDEVPTYDRPLRLEIWYPAAGASEARGQYDVVLRDGVTRAIITGRAQRDAAPVNGESFPLVILSHGYPGNRHLMAHLGENLASKGYVAVSIDHTDSTYSDQAAFGSTLYNRPLDQRFAIDAAADLEGPLGAIIDSDTTAVIGYSMGGYGALIFGGAGVTQASTEYSWGTPNGLLERHMAGTETHEALMDQRLKAIVAIGPWGRNAGFWDTPGAAGLRVPTLFVAGSADDVSVYDAMRSMFTDGVAAKRHLLTFENANHNAAAPMPAPKESWEPVENLEFVPFDHYADAVWDTVRMNNITQHFVTAFLDVHLKGMAEQAPYLDLVPQASDGVIALDEDGAPTEDHTYWKGFPARTAMGLRFETLDKGE